MLDNFNNSIGNSVNSFISINIDVNFVLLGMCKDFSDFSLFADITNSLNDIGN